jgi:peptidyl-prolyl cis-trans isomerase B (cyclophilin B)
MESAHPLLHRRWRFALVGSAVLAMTFGMTACASKTAAPAGTKSCSYGASSDPASRSVGTPGKHAPNIGTYTATIVTNRGSIVLKLDAAKAPCTVNSFVYLASKKYFDATPCHRLTTAGIFVLQCGDPTGTGGGGPGYQFADENLAGAVYRAGTVAMANAGPGTNGSQFFLVYKNTTLAPNYTPFGMITSGLDVLAKVAAAGDNDSNGPGDGKPKLAIEITGVTTTR